ncbi:MAG TPA: efflux RND transporter periplasmic adaptor subunit [Gemmatimonadaceae bacterium]|nr:efflux RND transporter periplasmic adaptor subunit [Gemmatimonadaceae bacterium]
MTNLTRTLLTAALPSALLALAACGKSADDAQAETTPVAVTIGPEAVTVVERQRIATGPAVSGTLAAEKEANIRAEMSGTILSTHADEGSRVAPGTLLARLDDRTVQDQFLSARSAHTVAKNAADLAARELARFERLATAGAISQRELEQARQNNEAAQGVLADARARLSLAQDQLDDARVRSPIAGIVSEKSVSAGDVVSPGAALFKIVDPRSMRYEASVPANQLTMIRVGAPVSFAASGYPGRTFEGRITRVNPTADATTGQVRIVVSVSNPGSTLVAGLFADGRVAAESHDGLTVPSNAVDQRAVKPTVVRLKAGRAERVEVELGIKDEERGRVEITKGVVAGDTLLVGAAVGISPGTPVRVGAPTDQAAVIK